MIFAALLFYALTVVAALRPPFSTRGIKRGVAIAYIGAAAAVMLDLLVVKPRYTWPGLLIVASGLPAYFFWMRRRFD